MAALPQEASCTIEYIHNLPDGQRAELIDGVIYNMSPPTGTHQRISLYLSRIIGNYIADNHGECEVFAAPYAVYLNDDDYNYVEPDVSVICDRSKLDENLNCHGAPDWVIEIISPSTEKMDMGVKLFKYRASGVRLYWIVNPLLRTVNVYDFTGKEETGAQYTFDASIPVAIYSGFEITLSSL